MELEVPEGDNMEDTLNVGMLVGDDSVEDTVAKGWRS